MDRSDQALLCYRCAAAREPAPQIQNENDDPLHRCRLHATPALTQSGPAPEVLGHFDALDYWCAYQLQPLVLPQPSQT